MCLGSVTHGPCMLSSSNTPVKEVRGETVLNLPRLETKKLRERGRWPVWEDTDSMYTRGTAGSQVLWYLV